MKSLHGSELGTQALRLPQHAREQLARLVTRLSAGNPPLTAAEVARGLCMLTLDLARGAAGNGVAEAVRIAARDPAPASVRYALCAIGALLDSEPKTTPLRDDPAAGARFPMPTPRPLYNQALRLPHRALSYLKELTTALRAAGAQVSAAEALRGLCLLALAIADGDAGDECSAAFCIAARDSTAQGQRRALEAVQRLLDRAASAMPEPSQPTGEAPPSHVIRLPKRLYRLVAAVAAQTVTDDDHEAIDFCFDDDLHPSSPRLKTVSR
jgi:hypothetical protein